MSKSLLLGRDNDALVLLLGTHAHPDPAIVDVTYNQGMMWRGTGITPTSMDIDPQFNTDYVGDFSAMPFADASYDVIVFDPPHLPIDGATPKASGIWKTRYGITNTTGVGRDGDNVSGMFQAFLQEAKRVLKDNGIVLAKIADLTHNHHYQWQHIDFITAAREAGLTACDLLIKADPNAGRLMSSKWRNSYHLRKAHCYWIVLRKGKCERSPSKQPLAEVQA